jgi:hypothetical protein
MVSSRVVQARAHLRAPACQQGKQFSVAVQLVGVGKALPIIAVRADGHRRARSHGILRERMAASAWHSAC